MSLSIRKNTALSLLWVLWIAALVAYVICDLLFYLFIAPVLLLMLMVNNIMFKKKANSNDEDPSFGNPLNQNSASLSNFLPEDVKVNTIIAADTQLKGNINLAGDIHVFGMVIGDVVVKEGSIMLMHNGKVEGNLTAPNIMIDGDVNGVCVADNLGILEHGRLNGIVKSREFSIQKGGVFVGQSEIKEEPDNQIMGKISVGEESYDSITNKLKMRKESSKQITTVSQEGTKIEDAGNNQNNSK